MDAQQIVIADRAIRSLTIGGKFVTTDFKAFVHALNNLGVTSSSSGNDGKTAWLVASPRGGQ